MSEAAGTSYTPGSWFGIVGENATVLLPPSEKGRAGSLWALVDDGGGFDEVLDALVSSGLRTLPGFVLVAKQDDVTRVVVRGSASATFETADGQVTVDGSGAATWAERSLTGVSAMKVDLGEESDGPTHVVTGGLVRVSGLQVPPPAAPTVPPPAVPPAPPAAGEPVAEEPVAEDAGQPAEEQGGFQAPALSVVPPPPPAPSAPPAAPAPPTHDPLTDPLTDSFSAPLPYDEVGDRDGAAEAEPPADQEGPHEPDEPRDVPYSWGDDVPQDKSFGEWQSAEDQDEAKTSDGPVVADDEFESHVGSAPGFPPPPPGFPPPPPSAPSGPAAPVPPPPPPGFTPSWETPPPPPPTEEPEQPAHDQEGPEDGPPAYDAPAADDHDGLTRAGAPAAEDFSRPATGIPGQPEAPKVTAYAVARLEFSSGDRVDVDRAVLVGRAPEAGRRERDDQPLLVTVPSPHQEISSTHCEIRPGTGVDHGAAVVTDLGSTNGTVLVQPGLPPEELRPGVPVQLMPGAVVDLGDGLTIRVSHP